MNTYHFELHGKCPVDDTHDVYEVELKSKFFIQCEDIVDFIKDHSLLIIYQEPLSRKIKDKFTNCEVKVTGYHSGIKVVCTL
tara:strand:+ start:943 stop:1188 length:246 start_codon:yes stop_codon:yes gene_type:complete